MHAIEPPSREKERETQLYLRAKELGVRGRSRMSQRELDEGTLGYA